MATNTNFEISTGSDQKLGQLKAILYLLQENVEKYKDEIDGSYELLKTGEMTDLTKKIDETLSNPLKMLSDVSDDLDQKVKQFVDLFVRVFLRKNKAYINSAFRSKTSFNDLHYSIVLKEDNMDNRNKIFEFLDMYDLMDISKKYPVYFQFVPHELIGKIQQIEELKIG